MLFKDKRLARLFLLPSSRRGDILIVILLITAGFCNENSASKFGSLSVKAKRALAPRSIGGLTGSGDSDDYSASCVVERQPNWTKDMVVHFFAAKNHSKATLRCGANVEINFDASTLADRSKFGANGDRDESTVRNVVEASHFQSKLLSSGLYDPSLDSYVIVHGFLASWKSNEWLCDTKDLILNNSMANVFIVDWSGGSKPHVPIDYASAVASTSMVGELIGELINQLVAATGQRDARKFHLIGHSLGAHISGFAGYTTNSTVGRITGLDPAGPCFSSSTPTGSSQELTRNSGYLGAGNSRRLSPDSGRFVLAIHTDTSLFGLDENCGHYDVYVNGGARQPKCTSIDPARRLANLLKLRLKDTLKLNFVCAHEYVHKIFKDFLPALRQFIPGMHHSRPFEQHALAGGLDVGFANLDQHELQAEAERCHPMAYECRSWRAFTSGECGICRDSDPSCVFSGLILDGNVSALSSRSSRSPVGQDGLHRFKRNSFLPDSLMNAFSSNGQSQGQSQGQRKQAERDDDHDDDWFNGEDYTGENGNDWKHNGELANNQGSRNSDVSLGSRHFIKSPGESPYCLYHYQVIVAVNTRGWSEKDRKRRYYYLQIPLAHGVAPSDKDSHSSSEPLYRIVQVSHLMSSGSELHSRLERDYMGSMRSGGQQVGAILGNQSQLNSVELYTALITFKVASEDECQGPSVSSRRKRYSPSRFMRQKRSSDSQSRDRKLCRPLVGELLNGAHLWASSKKRLNAVRWVALNYMSGYRESIRSSKSHLFVPARDNQSVSGSKLFSMGRSSKEQQSFHITSRSQEPKVQRPSLDELNDTNDKSFLNLPSRILSKTLQPVECLASMVTSYGSSSSNLKCSRTRKELKYALELDLVPRAR